MSTLEEAIRNATAYLGVQNYMHELPEVRRLAEFLQAGELPERIVLARRRTNHGVLIVTNLRLLFLCVRWYAVYAEDFGYDRITSVDYSAGLLWGRIKIHASGNDTEFTHIETPFVRDFAELVRTKIARKPEPTPASDPIAQLERLAKLREQGHITEEEFQREKAKLLGT